MFRATIYNDLEDPALQTAWDALEKSSVQTGFQTRAYIGAMAKWLPELAEAKPLFLLLCTRDTNRPALILPLAKKRHFGVKRLDFLDYWVADHQLPIFDPTIFSWSEAGSSAKACILAALVDFDVLAIRAMPGEWNGVANPLHDLAGEGEAKNPSFRLALDDENLAAVRANNSIYKQCRKNASKLQTQFGIELIDVKDAEEIDAVFDSMVIQRRTKFDAMGLKDNFANIEVQSFFRDLAKDYAPSDRALVLGFRAEGEWIASTFSNALGDMLVGQLFAAAPGPWMKHSPGNVSLCYEINWAKERGFKHYDFGAGIESYKERFGGELHQQYSSMKALTAAGQMYMAALDQKNRARRVKRSFRGHIENLSKLAPAVVTNRNSA
ncbi:MAG: GNAT family N-acetyltransferase [Pseudomonadota bacterium]